MDLLCKVCERSIIENVSKYNNCINCIAKMTKEHQKYTIINPNLDEIDKMLKDCITSQNKKFDIHFTNCEFNTVFDNNFKTQIDTNYFYNNDDITKTKSYFLYFIDFYKLQGYGYCNNDEMIIKTIGDKCIITYKHYIDQPMHMIGRRLNFVVNRRPQLINALDRSKNHPLIRKFSHIGAQ